MTNTAHYQVNFVFKGKEFISAEVINIFNNYGDETFVSGEVALLND